MDKLSKEFKYRKEFKYFEKLRSRNLQLYEKRSPLRLIDEKLGYRFISLLLLFFSGAMSSCLKEV